MEEKKKITVKSDRKRVEIRRFAKPAGVVGKPRECVVDKVARLEKKVQFERA